MVMAMEERMVTDFIVEEGASLLRGLQVEDFYRATVEKVAPWKSESRNPGGKTWGE